MLVRVCASVLIACTLSYTAQAQDFFDSLFDEPSDKPEPRLQAEIEFLLYETLTADMFFEDEDRAVFDTDTRAMLKALIKGEKWDIRVAAAAQHSFYLGDQFSSAAEFEPWESYGSWHGDSWDLSLGYKVTRFGRGAVSLFDVVNPQDFRFGLGIPEEWARRPALQVVYDHYFENSSLHLVYTPLYRETVVATTGSDWSPIQISQTQGLEELPVFEQSVQQQVFPGLIRFPADDFLHGELALNYELNVPGWDIGLYGLTLWDRIPLPQFTEDFKSYVRTSNQDAVEIFSDLEAQEVLLLNPLYIQKPERNYVAGADISTTFAGYTWRSEILVQPQYSVYRDDLEFLRPPLVSGLLGVDSLASSSFILSLNFWVQAILVAPGTQLLQVSPIQFTGVGIARWNPEWMPLSFEIRGGGIFNEGSFYARPALYYEPGGGHQLSFGAEIIEGPDDRISGAFSHNDSWFVRYKYHLTKDKP